MTFKPYKLDVMEIYGVVAILALVFLFLCGYLLTTAIRAARLEYRLDEQGLTIVWGRPLTIPYDAILSVRRVEGRPKLRRIVGTALPGLHEGSFTLAGVGAVRLYAGRIDDHLVIVEADRFGRLGLTPDDPDRFVAELRRRMQ